MFQFCLPIVDLLCSLPYLFIIRLSIGSVKFMVFATLPMLVLHVGLYQGGVVVPCSSDLSPYCEFGFVVL